MSSADTPSRSPSPEATRKVSDDANNGPGKMSDTQREAVKAHLFGLQMQRQCGRLERPPALQDDDWLEEQIHTLKNAEDNMRLHPVCLETRIEPGNFVFLYEDGGKFCLVTDTYEDKRGVRVPSSPDDDVGTPYNDKGWRILSFIDFGHRGQRGHRLVLSTGTTLQSKMEWVIKSYAPTEEMPADPIETQATAEGSLMD